MMAATKRRAPEPSRQPDRTNQPLTGNTGSPACYPSRQARPTRLSGNNSEHQNLTPDNANITPLAQRLALETRNVHVGWHIAIYPTDTRTATADPFVWLASVTHETATAGQLPDLVATALRSLACHEQHHTDADGRHQVSVGIEHWN